jgi:two-component system response regulator ResD
MKKSLTIYVIDDEVTIREVLRRYLEREGWAVVEAASGPGALALLRDQPGDLLLLDIMLPGMDGFQVARALRNQPAYAERYATTPIILLTSRGEEDDRLAGFELGVDDYVVKPFSPREVVARVKAVLRRSAPPEAAAHPLRFPRLHIDPARRSVQVAGALVSLTAREFDLLWLFACHPQQVFTREQLLDHVWGYGFDGDASTVTVHIRRLREKIEADPARPTTIQTVWGVGYKFEPEA